MPAEDLLRLLADGRYHSGEELGEQLSISRAAVWKQLRKLQGWGLALESRRGVGHRLPGGLDLLAAPAVSEALSERAATLMRSLELPLAVDSTNALLLARANTGESIGGAVLCAEQQRAGKGRRGRPWVSPFARNLYLSVGWEFDGGAAALEGLSLAVGVALSRALAGLSVEGVRLKWPNDVWVDGRKLAGILIDMAGDAAGGCQVVVGVGINVAMPAEAAASIEQPWTDLRALDLDASRSRILAAVLNELLPLLAGYERDGFTPWRDPWLALDACHARPVTLHLGQRAISGVAQGVDATGALLVDTEGGRRAFNGGEVSLRPAG